MFKVGRIEQLTTHSADPYSSGVSRISFCAPAPDGKCSKCHERPATERWGADGAVMAARGYVQFWCKRCCVLEQLAHATQMAARIPDLAREFAALELATTVVAVDPHVPDTGKPTTRANTRTSADVEDDLRALREEAE